MSLPTSRIAMALSLAILAFAASAPAQATGSGSLQLAGSVAQTCFVAGAPDPAASAIDLTTNHAVLVVGSVTETCNDRNGYKVSISTANGGTTGLFKGSLGNPDTLGYSVIYDGLTASFSSGSAQVISATTRTAPGGTARPVAISYTGNPAINSDTYVDVLTVTLSSN